MVLKCSEILQNLHHTDHTLHGKTEEGDSCTLIVTWRNPVILRPYRFEVGEEYVIDITPKHHS